MDVLQLLSALLLVLGSLLGLVGGIGVLRFPDFYTRMHAASVTDTLCAGLFLAGLSLHFGLSLATVKLLLIFVFILFTSPTAAHALAKTARNSGLAPWTRDQGRAAQQDAGPEQP